MQYLKVLWIHDFPDEPVELYSEIDESRMETRSIEVFRDGSCGFASETSSVGPTRLGEVPIPSLDEINSDPQFKASTIEKDDFERVWSALKP